MPDPTSQINAHRWLVSQKYVRGNLLPLRKFSPQHNQRGTIFSVGELQFMPSDNEPLAALYTEWTDGRIPALTLKEMLLQGSIPASWAHDTPIRPNGLRFGGVKSSFRDFGLKLAHINDAANGIHFPQSDDDFSVRFLRSLSPLNLFLFPSYKIVSFSLISTTSGWNPKGADWAEDQWIRRIAMSWLSDKIGNSAGTIFNTLQSDFGGVLPQNPDWKKDALGTTVRIEPRVRQKVNPPTTANSSPACPKVPRASAVSFEEALEILRHWRRLHPNLDQLDAGSDSNPSAWLHFKVDGYSSPRHDFVSCHGPIISGDNYNGIVNFHGDAKTKKIDQLIELVDTGECYQDILVPSATYEGATLPKGREAKPKFALQGYGAKSEGFYLYHD